MSESPTFGIIMGSVLITLIISAAGTYFILPLIFPNLEAEQAIEEGILLQSEFLQTETDAYIYDDSMDYTKMSDTEINISIQENSRILASFEAPIILHMNSGFSGATKFNISVVISGFGNRTSRISYYSGAALANVIEIVYNIHLTIQTEELPEGTYTVSIYWKSIVDSTISVLLNAGGGPYHYPRSLLVQEIKAS